MRFIKSMAMASEPWFRLKSLGLKDALDLA